MLLNFIGACHCTRGSGTGWQCYQRWRADIIIKTKGGFEAKRQMMTHEFKIGGRIQPDYNSHDGVINKEAR